MIKNSADNIKSVGEISNAFIIYLSIIIF